MNDVTWNKNITPSFSFAPSLFKSTGSVGTVSEKLADRQKSIGSKMLH